MDLYLTDQKVLITASTGGIGLAMARIFAREGAEVIINGRSEASVRQAMGEVWQELPDAQLRPLVADNGTAAGGARTLAEYPEVDILIHNLGIYENHDLFATTDADWQRLFEVNVQSGVRLSRHYLPGMLARGRGRILFISSESALTADADMAPYSATKLMQLSVARSLAQRTQGTAVTVNTLLPGSTLTPGVQQLVAKVFPGDEFAVGERRFMAENRPSSLIGRLIRPEEVADFAAFVCSPRAGAINGAALRVDGGIYRSVV